MNILKESKIARCVFECLWYNKCTDKARALPLND